MSDTGAGSSHGSRKAPKRKSLIEQLQTLAGKKGTKADQDLYDKIGEIVTKTKVDKNQQNTDTQKFFNGIKWADDKPVVVNTEKDLDDAKKRGDTSGQYFYHTDAPTYDTPDAKDYAAQFLNGRQYLSSGWHGDGTYFSNSEDDSFGYGGSRGYQIKGMLNKNAKVVQEDALMKMIKDFQKSHPKAFRYINRMSSGGWHGSDGKKSVFAALFGYNVVQSKQNGCDYLTIMNRGAVTVVRGGHYDDDKRNKQGSVWDIIK